MELGCVTPVVSSATLLGLAKTCPPPLTGEQLYELLYLLVFSDDFANLAAWTTTQNAPGSVALAGGVVAINGDTVNYTRNGINVTVGLARAEGYIEFKTQQINSTPIGQCSISSANALQNAWGFCWGPGGTPGVANRFDAFNSASQNASRTPVANDATWYTLRQYLLKGTGGTFCKSMVTISGGVFASETVIGNFDFPGAVVPNPFFPQFNRYTNNAANPTNIKEFRWYSGYSVAGPTLTYIHDAGLGYQFVNFDPTLLAMPGGLTTANLLFRWSFDDGVRAWSAWMTLANLNLVAKQLARHRYICIDVQVNSDGSTQARAAKPNHATAFDYVAPLVVVPTWGPGEPSGIH